MAHSLEAVFSVTDIVHGSEPEADLGVSSVSIEQKKTNIVLLNGICNIYILVF